MTEDLVATPDERRSIVATQPLAEGELRPMYSVAQATKRASLSRKQIYAEIVEGRLPAVRVGRKKLVVRHEEFCEWLESFATGPRSREERLKARYASALSLDELAVKTQVSKSLLYDQIAQGRLKTIKIGRRRLVLRADAEEWMNTLERAFPLASPDDAV